MGKKGNIQVPYPYDHEKDLEIADHLEEYSDKINSLFILEGKSEEEVKEARKEVKKAIKNLREGHPEKVFNEERYIEFLEDHGGHL